jgi:hypothetical protein
MYSSIDLDVDIIVELLQKVWIVRDNLGIIANHYLAWSAWFGLCKRPTIIATAILRISILCNDYRLVKRLRKLLRAL